MSVRTVRSATKSILKKSSFEDGVREHEIEARFWKTRFEELQAKRVKQRDNILRSSIWDDELLDSEEGTEMFKGLEEKIRRQSTMNSTSTDGSGGDSHRTNSSSDECKIVRLVVAAAATSGVNSRRSSASSQPDVWGASATLNGQTKCSRECQETVSSLRSEVCALIQEASEWRQKYEEAVDPEHIQSIRNSLLSDFISKTRLAVQEAAETLEQEKQAYITIKTEEMMKQVNERDEKVNAHERTLLAIREENSSLASQIISLKAQLGELREKVTAHEQTQLVVLEENNSLSSKIISLKAEMAKLTETFENEKKRHQIEEKDNIETIEEISEEKEDYRNKEYQLQQQVNQLSGQYAEVCDKLMFYERSMQEKAEQVQTLMVSLNQELQKYAEEVELAHEQEIIYQNELDRLNAIIDANNTNRWNEHEEQQYPNDQHLQYNHFDQGELLCNSSEHIQFQQPSQSQSSQQEIQESYLSRVQQLQLA